MISIVNNNKNVINFLQRSIPDEKLNERGDKKNMRRNFFSINKLPLLLVILGIVILTVVSPKFDGKRETIPTSEFPVYKSANQNDADGWVRMEVVSAVSIGKGETHTSVQGKNFMPVNSKYYFLYLVTDRSGNTAVYSDLSDVSFMDNTFGNNNEKLPATVYGKVGNFEKEFKSFSGYSQLSEYGAYDLITEYQYPAQTSHLVQSEADKSTKTILTYLSVACFAAAAILLVVLKKRNNKIEERQAREAQKQEEDWTGF